MVPAGQVEGTEPGTVPDLGGAPALGAILLLLGIGVARLARRRFPPARWGSPLAPGEGWGHWRRLEVAAAWCVGFLAFFLLTAVLPRGGVLADLLANVLFLGLTGGAVVAWLERRDPRARGVLGLGRSGQGRALLVGATAYLVALPILFGIYALWPWLLEVLGYEPREQDVLRELLELRGVPLAAGFLLAAVVVPFFEELTFRAILQPLLIRSLGPGAGVLGASLVFALLHPPSVFGPVFALSLLLGWLQLRTRRLAAAWAAHGLHNGLTLAMFLLLG